MSASEPVTSTRKPVASAERELRERFRFETFLADLALRFQRLPADQPGRGDRRVAPAGSWRRSTWTAPPSWSSRRTAPRTGSRRLRAAGDSAAGVRPRAGDRPALVHGAGPSRAKDRLQRLPEDLPEEAHAERAFVASYGHEVPRRHSCPSRSIARSWAAWDIGSLPPAPRVPARVPLPAGAGGQRLRQRALQEAGGGSVCARPRISTARSSASITSADRGAGPRRARHRRERGLGGGRQRASKPRRPLPRTGDDYLEACRSPTVDGPSVAELLAGVRAVLAGQSARHQMTLRCRCDGGRLPSSSSP